MRVRESKAVLFAGVLAVAAGAGWPAHIAGAASSARAFPSQAARDLLPEQSAARARELIQTAIQALGGKAYLEVRDLYRIGRLAQFSRTGELSGYIRFYDYVKLPDKNRTEYSQKRNIIQVYTSQEGWELDRGGVQEAPPESLERYQRGLKRDVDYLFRYRLNEEGMAFRYGGSDILDLKQVEWIEVSDRDRLTLRVALDRSTHLPIRAMYTYRDPATRLRVEEVEHFGNYHVIQGVRTPMQILRERNGVNYYQVFFEKYEYNVGLDDSLFTRASLEQAWAKLNKGKKTKEKNTP